MDRLDSFNFSGIRHALYFCRISRKNVDHDYSDLFVKVLSKRSDVFPIAARSVLTGLLWHTTGMNVHLYGTLKNKSTNKGTTDG